MDLVGGDVAHFQLPYQLVVLSLGSLVVLIVVVIVANRMIVVVIVVVVRRRWRV